MNARNPPTPHECRAMRELYRGEYSINEVSILFQRKKDTIQNHIDKKCVHELDAHNKPSDPYQEYTVEELLQAFRNVYEKQPYEYMSQKVYDDYRDSTHPCAATICRRFESWPEARRLAHE